jgi:glutamate racemase
LAEVREFAIEIMDRLVDDGVKALVIACNSASAATLRDARERYEVPVIEVVHPAVRRAAAATRSGRVGVIGTSMTITSAAYEDAFAAAPDIDVISVACPRFVEFAVDFERFGHVFLAVPISFRPRTNVRAPS